jgi:hypothetical protein
MIRWYGRHGGGLRMESRERSCIETFENLTFFVIPAQAGIQKVLKGLDSCSRAL